MENVIKFYAFFHRRLSRAVLEQQMFRRAGKPESNTKSESPGRLTANVYWLRPYDDLTVHSSGLNIYSVR